MFIKKVIRDYFGLVTNMVAETRALLMGIKKCLMEGWINIVVEADSGSHYQAANQVTTEYIF